MKLLTDIYRSRKKEGMYLYVKKGFSLEQLPEGLLQAFGRAERAMTLLLTPEKTLARADAGTVILSIEEKNYYLQMPPSAIECADFAQTDRANP